MKKISTNFIKVDVIQIKLILTLTLFNAVWVLLYIALAISVLFAPVCTLAPWLFGPTLPDVVVLDLPDTYKYQHNRIQSTQLTFYINYSKRMYIF